MNKKKKKIRNPECVFCSGILSFWNVTFSRVTPQGANNTVTYHLSRKLYKLDEPDMPDTDGEARTSS